MPELQCLSCGNFIFLDDATYANYQGPVVCVECKGRQEVIFQNQALITSSLVADIYEPIRDLLIWDIPYEPLLDIAEAAVDLGVYTYKSCVVMCRRCVQGVLLDHGVKDDPSMVNMIDEAYQKGILTQELKETANSVRFFAVTGAHPKDPLLRKVTKLQASLAMEVTKEILMHIYPLKPEYEELASQSETGSNGL